MARLIFLSVALFALSLFCCAANSARSAEEWETTLTPFTPGSTGEMREAQVQYNFGWNGLTAAKAELHLSRTADNHFRLETTGATTGVARTLWKFDVKNTSVSDARTLRPLQVHETETTRSKTFETEINFTPERATSRREEHRGANVKTKERSFDFPNVLSLNSAMLYLRSRPLPDGTVERLVVYPATTPYLCTIKVVGREHITVPVGSYDAIKLEVQLSKIGKKHELVPHKKFKSASVWLTNDADHLILRIEAQIFIGTVFAELQSVQFAKP